MPKFTQDQLDALSFAARIRDALEDFQIEHNWQKRPMTLLNTGVRNSVFEAIQIGRAAAMGSVRAREHMGTVDRDRLRRQFRLTGLRKRADWTLALLIARRIDESLAPFCDEFLSAVAATRMFHLIGAALTKHVSTARSSFEGSSAAARDLQVSLKTASDEWEPPTVSPKVADLLREDSR